MKDVLQASTAAHCAVMVGSLFGTDLTCLSLWECGTACPRFGTQSRAKTTPAASFSSRWVDAPAAAGEHPAGLPPAACQRWSAVCCLKAWSALLALCCNCHRVWLGQPHTECLALLGPQPADGGCQAQQQASVLLGGSAGPVSGQSSFHASAAASSSTPEWRHRHNDAAAGCRTPGCLHRRSVAAGLRFHAPSATRMECPPGAAASCQRSSCMSVLMSS